MRSKKKDILNQFNYISYNSGSREGKQLGMVAHTYNPKSLEAEAEDQEFNASLNNSVRL